MYFFMEMFTIVSILSLDCLMEIYQNPRSLWSVNLSRYLD
jgi:hypothetical protein